MSRRVASGFLIVALLCGAAWLLRPGEAVKIEIPEGLSARQTADLLREKGVIHSALAFRVVIKMTGADRKLKPGHYTLRVRELPTTTLRKLILGLSDAVKVTIPEGFRASQTAERLEAAGVVDAKDFLAIVEEQKLEGRLFPSTYYFPLGFGSKNTIASFLAEFDRQIGAAYRMTLPNPPLTLEQALTVASIVEREAVLHQERPIIAAVYLNRLKSKMMLQADPTVQYALGYWKKGLIKSDLLIDSPYNTYKKRGLPPGPICSPGLDSFKAVLSPARTSALYFVADTKGGHLFSTTNEQHSQARLLYKQELRKIKKRLRENQKK